MEALRFTTGATFVLCGGPYSEQRKDLRVLTATPRQGRNIYDSEACDNTGVVLWPAAFVLSKLLEQHLPRVVRAGGSAVELGAGACDVNPHAD
jgi:hypothetical protein